MRAPSSPALRTRPCPTFGRPVRLGFPHRLRPGTSPHALRIPPHGGHPALRSTASSGSRSALAVSSFRLRARLDVSIPSAFFGQRGITPAFGYGAPHSSARGTLTLLNNALLNAQYHRDPAQASGDRIFLLFPQSINATVSFVQQNMPPPNSEP